MWWLNQPTFPPVFNYPLGPVSLVHSGQFATMSDLYGTAAADADALIEGGALKQSHELSRDNRLHDSLIGRKAINPTSAKGELLFN